MLLKKKTHNKDPKVWSSDTVAGLFPPELQRTGPWASGCLVHAGPTPTEDHATGMQTLGPVSVTVDVDT